MSVPNNNEYSASAYRDAVLQELEGLILSGLDTILGTLTPTNLPTISDIYAGKFQDGEVFEQYRKWDIEPRKCAVLFYAGLFFDQKSGPH